VSIAENGLFYGQITMWQIRRGVGKPNASSNPVNSEPQRAGKAE